MLKTPILLLLFNRPETTKRVFAAIRASRPGYLYVAADGPRSDRPGEEAKCKQALNLVLENIDWDCQVFTLLRSRNLGCKMAVSSAITWFFEQVEEGIIMEDDTLPAPGFFAFCETLLEQYRHETRILHISGDNFQFGRLRGPNSYYFSIFPHIWGWATWRRAWKLYDPDIEAYPRFCDSGEAELLLHRPARQKQWLDLFDRIYRGEIDTWDYQWIFTLWSHAGLAVVPQVNLVSNIGFGDDATHTTTPSRLAGMETRHLGSLRHPCRIVQNIAADQFTIDHLFTGQLENRMLFPQL